MTPHDEERSAWLKQRAKDMRAEMTPHEKVMWRLLHEGELTALNWRRQAQMGSYVLDFVSHPAMLVVEVDGAQHGAPEQAAHDAARTEWLASQGYQVLRFWNFETVREQDGVWRTIIDAANKTKAAPRMKRWREQKLASVLDANARITSSSMEEVAAQRPEEVRALASKAEPRGAQSSKPLATPPLSALRADSSSIEEERS